LLRIVISRLVTLWTNGALGEGGCNNGQIGWVTRIDLDDTLVFLAGGVALPFVSRLVERAVVITSRTNRTAYGWSAARRSGCYSNGA